MPTAKGWGRRDGRRLPRPGSKVNAFAAGLDHPRWIEVLPNGDVLVAEALSLDRPARSVFDYAMITTMRRAAPWASSANRITLLQGQGRRRCRRDPRGVPREPEPAVRDGAGGRHVLCRQHGRRGGLFPTRQAPAASPRQAASSSRSSLPAIGREACCSAPTDESSTPASDRSPTSPSRAWRSEEGRAAIYEIDLAGGTSRIFAGGLRNARGARLGADDAGVLWTVVNERDGLGDETPPDYLDLGEGRRASTAGPIADWGQTVDDRVPQDPAMVAKAITPDYALGGHTASLGLCWVPAGTLPGFPEGMAIGQHGSWNRSKLSGYKLVHIPFANGQPAGRRATSSPASCRRTKRSRMAGRSG